jgi:hypothetical protein
MINRRKILKATAVGGSGLAALAYSPKPTLAASNWTVNSPSQVSNESGELSSLEIPASGFSFSLDYSGLGTGPQLINFKLEAKLSSDSSFETVLSDSFDVEGDSGTVDESKLSTSFPVDLLASTSMSASDFAESTTGETESTTVELRVSFNWSGGAYSASDSVEKSFVVDVNRQADPSFTTDSFTVNDPPTVSNENGELSSLELPKDDFSFSLSYDGFASETHSVDFDLEAKLESASTFETVFSESFEINGSGGSKSESVLSTSFPVDLLGNTSMSASDFNEPNAGETENTIVDFRVSFDWSDSEYSASSSATNSFTVTVVNESPQHFQAHWSFETDGSDVTGNGYDATVHGASHIDSGAHDGSGAYEFNSSSYLEAPFPRDSPFTFSIWARWDGNGSHRSNYIMKIDNPWNDITGFSFIVWNSGDLTVRLGDGGNKNITTYSGHMSDNNWHHLTIVYDGSSYTVYDGATKLSSESTGSISWGSNGITFGAKHDGDANRFNGRISDARFYDKPFTQQEVEDLHNETKA